MKLDAFEEYDKIITEFEEIYKKEQKFYEKINSTAKKISEDLNNISKTSKDENIKLISALLNVINARSMVNYSSDIVMYITLYRFALMSKMVINNMKIEILNINKSPPESLTKDQQAKIKEVEERLTKLDKEFKKYSPTLKEFRKAFKNTQYYLDEHR